MASGEGFKGFSLLFPGTRASRSVGVPTVSIWRKFIGKCLIYLDVESTITQMKSVLTRKYKCHLTSVKDSFSPVFELRGYHTP